MKRRIALLMLSVLPQLAGAGPVSGWQVLQGSKAASGGSAWDSVHSLKMTGTLSLGGMTGRIASYQDLVDAKTRTDVSIGPIRQATGFDGKTGWTLDSNGNVAPHDSSAERRADRTQAYLAARDYWFPRRWPAVVTRAGTVASGRTRYEVLRVAPRGGLPFQIWIDAATQRIDRIIVEGQFEREVTSYGDYRDVEGLALPFRVSVATARSGDEHTMTVSRVAVNGAVAAHFFDVPRQRPADHSFVLGSRSATIPFRFLGDHIYFPVRIGGHDFQFGLDTGGMNIITPRVARAIGAHTEGSAQATGVGAKRIAVSFARIPAVSLASSLTLRNQLFVVVPLSGISAVEGTTLDGVVGYELFKRFVIRIDYANQRLQILRPADLDVRSAGTSVAFTYDGRMPQVTGSLDGLPGRFDVDTGSRDALSINSPFVKAHHLLRHYPSTAPAVVGWGAGGASYARLTRVREFRLGSVAVACPVVALSTQAEGTDAERSVAGVIGNAMLSRFTVTFDYAKQLVYLSRNSRYARPFRYDRAGMWVNRLNRAFVIESVMSGGPAQQAGLREGDRIVSVDGRETAEVRIADFRHALATLPAGSRVILGVVRGGRALRMTLTVRNLVSSCAKLKR